VSRATVAVHQRSGIDAKVSASPAVVPATRFHPNGEDEATNNAGSRGGDRAGVLAAAGTSLHAWMPEPRLPSFGMGL